MNHLNENTSKHLLVRTIEGKTYDGVVKQKEEAEQQYSRAVSRGESAGIVRYSRNRNRKLITDVLFQPDVLICFI